LVYKINLVIALVGISTMEKTAPAGISDGNTIFLSFEPATTRYLLRLLVE